MIISLAKPWPPKLKKLDHVKHFIKSLDKALKGCDEEPKVLATPSLGSAEGRCLLVRWDGERALSREVAAEPEALRAELEAPPQGEPASFYLVCTHGSRDRCCGTFGYPVYQALEAGQSERRVLQVSHLGGHRYAPTLLALPEWRFFGHLSPEKALEMHRSLSQGRAFLEGYRGHGRLKGGRQAVEARLWEEHGSALVSFTQLDGDKQAGVFEARLVGGERIRYRANLDQRETVGYKSCEDVEEGKQKTIKLPFVTDLVRL